MMRNIFLIRHGEPEFPLGRRRCISSTDLPLSEVGHAQGERLRIWFSDIALTGVYTSPLLRARQTARYLSPQAESIPALRELGVGAWEGLPFTEIRQSYPNLYALRGEDPIAHVMPGGEPPEDCLSRALQAINDLCMRNEGNFAVVAHAGVNRLLLCHLLGRDLREFLTLSQPYGSISILREKNGVLAVKGIGILPQKFT